MTTNEELNERELEQCHEEIRQLKRCIDRAINELRSDNPDEALRCLEGLWT